MAYGANAYRQRAVARNNLDRFAEAIADCEKAMALSPSHKGRAHLHYVRGWAKGKLQESEQAIADFNAAINLNPQLEHAFVARGQTHAACGELTEAVRDFTSALRIDPKNEQARAERESAFRGISDSAKKIEICCESNTPFVVRVVSHNSPVKVGEDVITRVERNDLLYISRNDGSWLRVAYVFGDDLHLAGWIQAHHVRWGGLTSEQDDTNPVIPPPPPPPAPVVDPSA